MGALARVIVLIGILFGILSCSASDIPLYDVVIVGGGTAGTVAAIQAGRMGSETLLLAESEWLGGMLTAAGVSAVDGNYRLQSGLFGEFRRALVDHYGSDEAIHTGWVSRTLYEPSVGNRILQEMVAAVPKIKLESKSQVIGVKAEEFALISTTLSIRTTSLIPSIARLLLSETTL